MPDAAAFGTFPHFFSGALELYRYSTILYFNVLEISAPLFIKRNFQTRLITNAFFPGAYESCVALIENDDFLLSAVDLRRLVQLAQDMDFGAGPQPRRSVGGVELPAPLWNFFDEALKLPLSSDTRLHRAILHYFLWQLAKYYIRDDTRSLEAGPSRSLVSLVKFYSAEVKRVFRGNREVNEAHFKLTPEQLGRIPARIIIADLPLLTGYYGIPDFLQVRELIADREFTLERAFPRETYPGSPFDSVEAMLRMLDRYLRACEHIEFWLLIVREPEVEKQLLEYLEGKRRRSRWFDFPLLSGGTFRYLIARRM